MAKCLSSKRESKSVEFKEEFNPGEVKQSLEILKDLVAIANSGGGALVVGINNAGEASGADVTAALNYDHAKYCDLIRKYTMQNFADFEVVEGEKDGKKVAVFLINGPEWPLVFEKPGTYPIENNKQQTAFGQGTIYFRHGAKSETGTSEDLRKFTEQRIREMQDRMVKGMRKVAVAPRGSHLEVVPARGTIALAAEAQTATPVRITDDPEAPGAVLIDRHDTCPYRQKEVLRILKERLPGGTCPTSAGIQALNKVHRIADKPAFSWKPQFSSRQYSMAYVDWLVEQITGDDDFLQSARAQYNEMNHPAKPAPLFDGLDSPALPSQSHLATPPPK